MHICVALFICFFFVIIGNGDDLAHTSLSPRRKLRKKLLYLGELLATYQIGQTRNQQTTVHTTNRRRKPGNEEISRRTRE